MMLLYFTHMFIYQAIYNCDNYWQLDDCSFCNAGDAYFSEIFAGIFDRALYYITMVKSWPS